MLSHINEHHQPQLVAIDHKETTARTAMAISLVEFPESIKDQLRDGEIHVKKGPVFATAIIAGTMAVKKCSDIIPLCHPLPIEKCNIEINVPDERHIEIHVEVKTQGKTGVEMEALTGASVTALTIYDMCKAITHGIKIINTHLVSKSGGKRDFQQ